MNLNSLFSICFNPKQSKCQITLNQSFKIIVRKLNKIRRNVKTQLDMEEIEIYQIRNYSYHRHKFFNLFDQK